MSLGQSQGVTPQASLLKYSPGLAKALQMDSGDANRKMFLPYKVPSKTIEFCFFPATTNAAWTKSFWWLVMQPCTYRLAASCYSQSTKRWCMLIGCFSLHAKQSNALCSDHRPVPHHQSQWSISVDYGLPQSSKPWTISVQSSFCCSSSNSGHKSRKHSLRS